MGDLFKIITALVCNNMKDVRIPILSDTVYFLLRNTYSEISAIVISTGVISFTFYLFNSL